MVESESPVNCIGHAVSESGSPVMAAWWCVALSEATRDVICRAMVYYGTRIQ